MLHYHGTPITPVSAFAKLAGRCFCVSFAAPGDLARAHESGQSVMLDSGAFTAWTQGRAVDWTAYMEWCEPWLDFPTTWAVIPDVIDGDEDANDRLVAQWSARGLPRGAPVWHLHEPLERLQRLASEWERVCLGSSAQYAVVGSPAWHRRMQNAMNALCGSGPVPVWLHMLRGMSLAGSEYPFASVDSADVARNHAGNRSRGVPRRDPAAMAARWDAIQNPARWSYHEQLTIEGAA